MLRRFFIVFFLVLLAPTSARAELRLAVKTGPDSTTRWSEITMPSGPAAGWLVPIRPGATVEWASPAYLSAAGVCLAGAGRDGHQHNGRP